MGTWMEREEHEDSSCQSVMFQKMDLAALCKESSAWPIPTSHTDMYRAYLQSPRLSFLDPSTTFVVVRSNDGGGGARA